MSLNKPNVLFVFLDIEFTDYALYKGCFHYGLASISAYLKSHLEANVELMHIKNNISNSDFINQLKNKNPDIVAFTATSNNFPVAAKYVESIKEFDKNIFAICGGVHATLNTEEALLNSKFDVIIKGDGEKPFKRVVEEWIRSRKIPQEEGVWYKDNHGRIVNGGISIIDDLDSLPLTDWNLFDFMSLNPPSNLGIGGLMISRGCPYKCTYCCNTSIVDEYQSKGYKYLRFMSVGRAIAEIKNFIILFPKISTLYFDDDILPLKKEWFFEFAGRYKTEVGLPYYCNIRPNLISEEVVLALKNSGCIRIGIGIESGNENLRFKIMKRDYTDDDLRKAFSIVRKHGIFIYTFNMVGLPFEGKKELLDTIKLNTELKPDLLQVCVFYPYKKTELYDICIENRLIQKDAKALISYRGDSILNLGRIQKNRVVFTEVMLIYIVKIGKYIDKNIFDMLLQVLYSKIFALTILPVITYSYKFAMSSEFIAKYAKKLYRKINPPPNSRKNDV